MLILSKNYAQGKYCFESDFVWFKQYYRDCVYLTTLDIRYLSEIKSFTRKRFKLQNETEMEFASVSV